MASKNPATSAEVFEFPAFDINKMTETYRDFADRSANQGKEAYAKAKTVTEEGTKAIEAAMESAQAGTVELSLKAIDAARANAEHSFSHLEAMLGVKSAAQMIELQSTFFRKQTELMVDQAKVLQEAARKVAEDVTKPVKSASEKAVSEFKAA